MGRWRRLFRHVCAAPAGRRFPAVSLDRIASAIAAGERRHQGEVCFAIESALPARRVLAGVDARLRAGEAFAALRVWDTAENNGVLVYLLLADHAIEIVADRGLEGRVPQARWQQVCELMRARLQAGEFEAGALAAVEAVSDLLAEHWPGPAGGPGEPGENELPDRPRLL